MNITRTTLYSNSFCVMNHLPMGRKVSLSVVVPAYNEADRIEATLDTMVKYIPSRYPDHEVIVIDDGSKDTTRKVVSDYMTRNTDLLLTLNNPRENRGKGYSVKQGMMMANGKYRIFTDADGSTSIDQEARLMPFMRQGSVAIGSRKIDPGTILVRQPFYREMMGDTFNFFVRHIAGVHGIKDTQCGFKGFPERAAEAIFPEQKMERFSFDVELLYLAAKKGFRIEEVPVIWINCAESKVDPVKDSIDMFKDLVRIRWMHFGGE